MMMKKILTLSIAVSIHPVVLFAQNDNSIAGPEIIDQDYRVGIEEAAWDWRPGDLVFRNNLNQFDEIVRQSESGDWASVAVLRPSSGGPVAIYVDEKIGVTETPLDAFINGQDYVAYRVDGLDELRSEEYHAGPMALYAGITALEAPYDYEYLFDNQKFYNSELAFAAALNAGVIIGTPTPLRELSSYDDPLAKEILKHWRDHTFCIEALDDRMCWDWISNISLVTPMTLISSDKIEQVFP
jgi:hypothetical protein